MSNTFPSFCSMPTASVSGPSPVCSTMLEAGGIPPPQHPRGSNTNDDNNESEEAVRYPPEGFMMSENMGASTSMAGRRGGTGGGGGGDTDLNEVDWNQSQVTGYQVFSFSFLSYCLAIMYASANEMKIKNTMAWSQPRSSQGRWSILNYLSFIFSIPFPKKDVIRRRGEGYEISFITDLFNFFTF